MDDKEAKVRFKKEAQQKPEKFYPVKALKELGFNRGKCGNCGVFFWSVDGKRNVCGDANCVGGFGFIGVPRKKKLDYVETWNEFAKIHKKLGYTPIKRYPVVARWRDDTDFVQAGIYVFQPYVVSGEVKPVANPVVEPQFCLRFNDIDNVGITGSHYVGFVMLGEHAFMPPAKYDVNKYLQDHLTWLNKGMGLELNEIAIHEDAWAGGGNLGPSVEFFSKGLELSNQVYMQYEVLPGGGYKELAIKVLDMGQGQERVPWFTSGKSTSYETTFPGVMKKLRKLANMGEDKELMNSFMKYAAWLNVDEVVDVEGAWRKVADKVGIRVGELRKKIQETAALYSVAEHSRALLVALNDGALFSNVGGGYNLRAVFRRLLDLAAKYDWQIDLAEICKWHAAELKQLFPELSEHLGEVRKILEVEKSKYDGARQKTASAVAKIVRGKVSADTLLKLYDSQGISPELVREEAAKINVKVDVPENFYAKVAELHEKKGQVHETKKEIMLPLTGLAETKALYFGDWHVPESFKARVLSIFGEYVVLDQTWFYPTSGGQLHDAGTINGVKVADVFKQGAYIVHKMISKPDFKTGDVVNCRIDTERRKQLAQHHTTTHIINAAARKVLGMHANQAGAKKTLEKATIDITHYASLSDKELVEIEKEANAIVQRKVNVNKSFMPREEAEAKFGVIIYQGGVAPGKLLRIVEIPGYDVEACGGTHLNNTSEAEVIHVIGSSKIADDIVRIEFVAGEAARRWEKEIKEIVSGVIELVNEEFGVKVSAEPNNLKLAADVFSVSVEQLFDTIKKFVGLVDENNKLLKEFDTNYKGHRFGSGRLEKFCSELFEHWKKQNKEIEKMHEKIAREQAKGLRERSVAKVELDAAGLNEIAAKFNEILLLNDKGLFVFKGSDEKFEELVVEFGAKGGGREVKQGRMEDVNRVLKEFRF